MTYLVDAITELDFTELDIRIILSQQINKAIYCYKLHEIRCLVNDLF